MELGDLGGLWRAEELVNDKGKVQEGAIVIEEDDSLSWSELKFRGMPHAVRAAEAVINVVLLGLRRAVPR